MKIALPFALVSSVAAFAPTLSISSISSSFRSESSLASTDTDTDTDKYIVNIALTREDGKNDKLQEAINEHPTKKMLASSMSLNLVEMPCIEHRQGPDLGAFQNMAKEDPSFAEYDYIVITSPESAKVFGDAVNPSELSSKIAAVGKATSKALTKIGFEVDFVPSKANGEALANELPPVKDMGLNNVLYPASAKAAETIQDMLGKRKGASFRVYRLNTYDTVPTNLSEEQIEIAINDVQIACFGSPTAVDAWLENVDKALGIEDLEDEEKKKVPGSNGNAVAVCIGTTTANRCLQSGRWISNDIYYPAENPGLEGWVDCCFQASGDVMERDFWGCGDQVM